MARIPGPLDVMADPVINSTRRIPNTDTGGAMVGRAVQNLGGAIGSLGSALGRQQKVATARAEADQQKYDAWQADNTLFTYQQQWAKADEAAAVGMDEMGTGYHDSGVAYAAQGAPSVDAEIDRLNKAGNYEQAARLQEGKRRIELGGSTRLRQKEFQLGQTYELDYLKRLGEESLTTVGVDPDMNDMNRSRYENLVRNSRYLTEPQKEGMLRAQSREELARELELIQGTDKNGMAKTLGMPRPDAPYKQAVYDAALANGIDPELAIAVAQMESKFNPQAVNENSGAYGLFQTKPGTARELGGVRGAGVGNQIQTGMRYMQRSISAFQQKHGRDPSKGEYYMMHLLGTYGGSTVAGMSDDTPIMQALEYALRNDPDANPTSVYNQNGKVFGGVATVGDLKNRAEQLMQAELQQAYGGDTAPVQQGRAVDPTKFTPQDTERLRSKISYDLAGKKRPHKPQEYVALRAAYAVEQINPNWRIVVHSGMGEHGSDRHRAQHGGKAADIYVVDEKGQTVSINNYPEAIPALYRSFAAAGFKGLGWYGHGNASIHVDDVRTGMWGPNKSRNSMPQHIADAIAQGRGEATGGAIFAAQGEADPRYASLTLDQRRALYKNAATATDQQNKASADAYTAQYNAIVDQYQENIATQGAAFSIDEVKSDDRLEWEDKEKLIKAYETENKEAIGVGEALRDIMSGAGVDTSDRNASRYADMAFEQTFGDSWKTGGAPMERASAFLQAGQYIPKTMTADIKSGLTSGDVKALSGIGLIADLAANAPELFKGDNGKFARDAGIEYNMLRQRMNEQDAKNEMIRRYAPEELEKRRQFLKNDFVKKELDKVTSLEGLVEQDLLPAASVEGGNVMQATALQGVYRDIVETLMVRTGKMPNDETLLAQAKAEFDTVYGEPAAGTYGGEQSPGPQYRPIDRYLPKLQTGFETDFMGNVTPVKGHDYVKMAVEPVLQRMFGERFAPGQRWVPTTTPAAASAMQRGDRYIPLEVAAFDSNDVLMGTTTVVLDMKTIRDEAKSMTEERALELEEQRREQAAQQEIISEQTTAPRPPAIRSGPNVTEQLMQPGMPGQENAGVPSGPLSEAIGNFFTPDLERQRANTPARKPRPVPQAPGLAQQAVDTILKQGPQGAAPRNRP